jgi:lipopolysaccharide transport system permease protein/teichoic acid transport system permease protein
MEAVLLASPAALETRSDRPRAMSALFLIVLRSEMNSAIRFLLGLYRARRTIRALASRQLVSRYAGTLFRGAWELIHPAVTILVFWFVFSIAFKAKGPEGIPYINYFITGILPWMFFAEGVNSGTQGVVTHSFLVKKMVFRSELLPFVYLSAGTFNHCLLLILASVVLFVNGVYFTWYWFQIIYYFFTLCALMVGLQWLLSAITVFQRDLGQGVAVVLNLWFWATPVVWVPDGVVTPEYQLLLLANPVYYVIEGYRGSFLYHEAFWHRWEQGLYVWGVALILALSGAMIFRRLKPHFGDVL